MCVAESFVQQFLLIIYSLLGPGHNTKKDRHSPTLMGLTVWLKGQALDKTLPREVAGDMKVKLRCYSSLYLFLGQLRKIVGL